MASLSITSLTPATSTPAASFSDIHTITPHVRNASSRLVLNHATPEISVVDAGNLQIVSCFRGVHEENVTCVVTSTSSARAYNTDSVHIGGAEETTAGDSGIWTAGKDGKIVNWDERSGSAGQVIAADLKGPLPLLSLAISEGENLVVGGSELTAYEAHILFWDVRNASSPLLIDSSTHTDDITHLQFLSPSSASFHLGSPPSAIHDIPSSLLLSTSYDGLISLTDADEGRSDAALYSSAALDGGIKKAGWYWAEVGRGKRRRKELKIWATSDLDSVGTWTLGRSLESNIVLQDHMFHPVHTFEPLSVFTQPLLFNKPRTRLGRRLPAVDDGRLQRRRVDHVACDYMIDVCPSLGMNARTGESMIALGNNSGDIVLVQHEMHKKTKQSVLDHKDTGTYESCAILRTPEDGSTGHKDVVQCVYHDVKSYAQSSVIYSGSRDGVLSGWTIPTTGLSHDSAHIDQDYAVDGNSLTGEETSSEEEDDDMAVDNEERDGTEFSESTMSDRRKRRRV